jgi:hypothetical protein
MSPLLTPLYEQDADWRRSQVWSGPRLLDRQFR